MHAPIGSDFDFYIAGPLLAAFGGVVSYLQNVRSGGLRYFSVAECVGESVISGFVGLMVGLFSASRGLSGEALLFFCGAMGHLGGRGLALIERAVLRRLGLEEDKP